MRCEYSGVRYIMLQRGRKPAKVEPEQEMFFSSCSTSKQPLLICDAGSGGCRIILFCDDV